MRTRANKIEFWANDEESQKLIRYARSCKMSKSAYMRQLINGYEPQAVPPYEYHEMIRQLRAVGNSLNQIAHRAHVTGSIDTQEYRLNMAKVTVMTDELAATFLPQRASL